MIEASENELVIVGEYRQTGRKVQMRADAAAALRDLLSAAQASGVGIIPISGFRGVAYQEMLFRKAVAKYGSEETAARWVARSGQSEHHSGLAIDLGDEQDPASDVETAFEQTMAFRWLDENAPQFDFEMSFPRNNPRGVNYEPWHWRFVGSPEARQIFLR